MTTPRSQPRAQPVPRVPRSRRDDRYVAGHPTPAKHAYAGWVMSVQDDTCTVQILEEDIPDVIPLGDMPPVGAIVEVEARGDLLVIPFYYEGPVPPLWLTLPDVQRTMVPAGYTTPQGTNGWSPGGSEFALHTQRLHIYAVNGPVFNPESVFNIGAAWDCGYTHAYNAEEGQPYWNVPTTSSSWSGSAECAAPSGAVVLSANATTGVNGVTVRASTSASGSQDALRIESRATAVWIDLAQIKTSHLGHISSPSGGLPDPVPPPGMVLVWENPTSALTKIEVAISEPTTNANSGGPVYLRKINPGSGEYGPVDPTGASINWTIGNALPGGSLVPGYSGGEAPWTEVTGQINETGKTWFMFVSALIHDRAGLGTGTHPFDQRVTRLDLRPAFRFSVTPSRYRFVPAP